MELKIECLSKSYGSKQALRDVSCSFTEGIYGLLGPNGAGKTTMMNLIVNNLIQDHGQITLDGEDIRSMGKRYRGLLGFMPQHQGLYDDFTGQQFLGYMGALKGMDKKQLNLRIDEVLEMVNLVEESKKKLGSFSGGMKQRILIAQAILNDPKILILDEPTAGLDPRERIRIRNLISKISFHKIVLIATHVVSDIEFISNEILLLKQGELLGKASPSQLLSIMEGKVYEVYISEGQMEKLGSTCRVCSMVKDEHVISARIITDMLPSAYEFKPLKPSLEDLYLYLYEDQFRVDPKVLEQLKICS